MEQQASDIIIATRTAFTQAAALGVQYSFSIVGAIILLMLGWLAARILRRWTLAGLSRVHGIDETLAHFFANIVRYAVLVLVFVTVLGQFGVQTASIIAALGAIGLAIGLALQGTLQNIAAGIMLLVLRPFRVGEYIQTTNIAGTIIEVGLFATEMRTTDGLYLLAPNSTLWNTPVTNYSREKVRRHDLTVTLAPQDNLESAQDAFLDLVKSDPRVEHVPAPDVFVADIAGGVVTITVRYWVKTPDWWQTTRDLTKKTKLWLDQRAVAEG